MEMTTQYIYIYMCVCVGGGGGEGIGVELREEIKVTKGVGRPHTC